MLGSGAGTAHAADTVIVSGRVVDASGQGVPGARVQTIVTNASAVTDATGAFYFPVTAHTGPLRLVSPTDATAPGNLLITSSPLDLTSDLDLGDLRLSGLQRTTMEVTDDDTTLVPRAQIYAGGDLGRQWTDFGRPLSEDIGVASASYTGAGRTDAYGTVTLRMPTTSDGSLVGGQVSFATPASGEYVASLSSAALVTTARYRVRIPRLDLAGQPTGFVAEAGDAAALVRWQAPADVGRGITGYRLTARPTSPWSSERAMTAPATATSTLFDGLSNFESYTLSIAAITADGEGPATTQETAVAPVIGPPTVTYPASTFNLVAGTPWSSPVATSKGGARPHWFTAVGLPPGLEMTGSNGVITGTPAVAGAYPVQITVTDSDRRVGTTTVTISVEGDMGFVALPPGRLMDTRGDGRTVDDQGARGGALAAGQVQRLQVTGRHGIPTSGVSAVVLNVTVPKAGAASHLTVWPAGGVKPNASNLNYTAGQTAANAVVVAVGSGGGVSLSNAVSRSNVIVDVAGWFPTGGDFTAVTPGRLMDTRANGATVDGQAARAGAVGPGETRRLTVAGRHGVPARGVGAVALNVTAVTPTSASHITVWPAGSSRPNASNLNFAAGRTTPNMVVAKVGTNGAIDIVNAAGQTHVVVDLAGWFAADGTYVPLDPARVMDTRADGETVDGEFAGTGPLTDQENRRLQITGRHGVPMTGVDSVVLNITAVRPPRAGHLTVWPSGRYRPNASSLNFAANEVRANLVTVKLGPEGTVDIASAVTGAQVVVDVAGWYSSEPLDRR